MCIGREPIRTPLIDNRHRSIIATERELFSRFEVREETPPLFAPRVDPPEKWDELMRILNPDRK